MKVKTPGGGVTSESLTTVMSGLPEAEAVAQTDDVFVQQNDIHVLFEGETTVYTFRGQYGGKDAFTKQGVETPVDFEAENDVIYFSPPNARWFVMDGDAGTIAFSLSDTANVWEATNWVDYSDLPVAITLTPIPTLKRVPVAGLGGGASIPYSPATGDPTFTSASLEFAVSPGGNEITLKAPASLVASADVELPATAGVLATMNDVEAAAGDKLKREFTEYELKETPIGTDTLVINNSENGGAPARITITALAAAIDAILNP